MKKENKMNCRLTIEQVKKSGKRYDNYVLTLEDGTSFKVAMLPFYPKSLRYRVKHVINGDNNANKQAD